MDFPNVNPNPIFVNAPVGTAVEKKDREAPQVKLVETSAESSSAALGDKELHSRQNGNEKTADAMSSEALARIATDIQGQLDQMGSTLGFAINKKYDSLVAEITNHETGELVRQIPSEDLLALQKKLKEVVGLFFDEKL